MLRLRRELADCHVLDHALAQRADALIDHGILLSEPRLLTPRSSDRASRPVTAIPSDRATAAGDYGRLRWVIQTGLMKPARLHLAPVGSIRRVQAASCLSLDWPSYPLARPSASQAGSEQLSGARRRPLHTSVLPRRARRAEVHGNRLLGIRAHRGDGLGAAAKRGAAELVARSQASGRAGRFLQTPQEKASSWRISSLGGWWAGRTTKGLISSRATDVWSDHQGGGFIQPYEFLSLSIRGLLNARYAQGCLSARRGCRRARRASPKVGSWSASRVWGKGVRLIGRGI